MSIYACIVVSHRSTGRNLGNHLGKAKSACSTHMLHRTLINYMTRGLWEGKVLWLNSQRTLPGLAAVALWSILCGCIDIVVV